jgi:hypothetical protein
MRYLTFAENFKKMNRLFTLIALSAIVSFGACNSAEKETKPADVESIMRDPTQFTTMQWLDTALSFGTAKKGEKVHLTFRCKNTGDKALYLYDVKPSCGCTLVDYTKDPIAPGKEGQIVAEVDTKKGGLGEVHKTVFVRSNNSNHAKTYLTFTGTVLMPDSSVAAKK